jgi:hypothetical protein
MHESGRAGGTLDERIAALAQTQGRRTLVVWASDCAERVLPFFEEKRPLDRRPREAIAAARAWVRGEIKVAEARRAAFAAHAAARDAVDAGSRAAARAAGHAAAAAHVAGHSVHAAAYAATAAAHAGDSTNADAAATNERDWQYEHLLVLGANSL